MLVDKNCAKDEKQDTSLIFKLMTLGETCVGKDELLRSFVGKNRFQKYPNSIGVDFHVKTIQIEDKEIKLKIWDTLGQERIRNIDIDKSTQGILLVYDITNYESFDKINNWIENIIYKAPKLKMVLVGNRCELSNQRKVSIEEAEYFANKYNIKFFEASPKDGTNVNEVFYYLANEIYQESKLNGNKAESGLKQGIKNKDKKDCLIF